MKGDKFRSGFVALVGRPNVGKSTLLNKFLGEKLAIMSDKPQTTRNKIQAVLNVEGAQIVFIDTPGIHKPKHKLGEFMVRVAQNVLHEVDVILFLAEANQPPAGPGDRYIIEQLKETETPVILVLNKIDLVARQELLPLIDAYRGLMDFAGIVPVSALAGDNLDQLRAEITRHLPEGPQYYPDDMITDQPERVIMAELIREQVLHLTRDEIPHSVAVDIEEVKTRPNDTVYVHAVIYTERDSQKGIIVGKSGQMISKIGANARREIENLLGSKVYLELFVKVSRDWRNKEKTLRNLGYES
ncbi:MAG: GTPase Era [Bacillota bacterium]